MPRTTTLLATAVLLAGCGGSGTEPVLPEHHLIVIGIDGADWGVIRALWERDELPNLRRLANEGVSAPLRTAYGKSPVIWTTIATGRTPREHGITGFVVPGPEGQVPVSSTVRRVPALWNMVTVAGRRTAVLGWWASWPAETIDGVVVSDRALSDVEHAVSPAAFGPRFQSLRDEALAEDSGFGGNPAARDRDRVTARIARELAGEGFDLLLVYFRGVDIASHFTWKAWDPGAFPDPDPQWVDAHADDIPSVYRATDAAIGEILEASAPANVLVVSDHGFHAIREMTRVVLDLDPVLERLGLLARTADGGVDRERSIAWTGGSASDEDPKHLVLRDGLDPAERSRLEDALSNLRYASGRPVLHLRPPRPAEARRGADLVAKMHAEGASEELLLGDEPLGRLVTGITRISGSHGEHTAGIFIARGPDLDPRADPEGIHIHDLAPTFLYALGLPVGDDMAGEARTDLFTESFRQDHPLHTVPTWGNAGAGVATTSRVDGEIVEELRSLGYLD